MTPRTHLAQCGAAFFSPSMNEGLINASKITAEKAAYRR